MHHDRMIMISVHQIARVLLLLAIGVLLLVAWDAPEILRGGGLAVLVGCRAAVLYALAALVYLAFPTRRRVDLTCFLIFASWAFELRDPSGAYELLMARMVGDTIGAVAMLVPSYVERLRALDRSGGELHERRRWRPAAPRPARQFLGLPAPFAADDRQK